MPTLIAAQDIQGNAGFIYFPWVATGRSVVHIGRTVNPGLHLPSDNSVSARHARVREDSGRYFLEDLGSTNGTEVLVLGARMPLEAADGPHELADQEWFWVGNTQVQFVLEGYHGPESDEHAAARRQVMLRNANTCHRAPRRRPGEHTEPSGPRE